MSVGKGCISIRFKNRICVKMLEPNDYVAMILGHMVIAVLCSETRDWLFSWTIKKSQFLKKNCFANIKMVDSAMVKIIGR